MAITSAAAVQGALVVHESVAAARNRTDVIRARWSAYSCVERIRAVIHEGLNQRNVSGALELPWHRLDLIGPVSVATASGGCEAQLSPVGATWDVNAVTGVELQVLLESLGLTEVRASELAADIMTRRDPTGSAGEARRWRAASGFADARELRRLGRSYGIEALDGHVGVYPARMSLRHVSAAVLRSLPGFGDEAVKAVLARRQTEYDVSISWLIDTLPPASTAALRENHQRLSRLLAPEPEAWIISSTGRAGEPALRVTLEVTLARDGARAAIMRRRTWLE